MFGPNVIASFDDDLYFHHRSTRFHEVIQQLNRLFDERLGLQDFRMLVVTGSGTLVNEIVKTSLRGETRTAFSEFDVFGKRLASIPDRHQCAFNDLRLRNVAYVAYETALSRYNLAPSLPTSRTGLLFADMVSAFPYYNVPSTVDVFTTVSSKQLGAYPVLGLIGIRKNIRVERYFWQTATSILDLQRHLDFADKYETAHTAAIPLYVSLMHTLEAFNKDYFVRTINARRQALLDVIPSEYVLGDGPVLTLRRSNILEPMIQHFDLYAGVHGYQIFLWSGHDEDYDNLYSFLKDLHLC